MAIRTSKIAAALDDENASAVQPSDINPELVPSSPQPGDIVIERSGTSPSRYIAIKVYDGGEWRILADLTY